jgi:CheY-like chemotaxis protein
MLAMDGLGTMRTLRQLQPAIPMLAQILAQILQAI